MPKTEEKQKHPSKWKIIVKYLVKFYKKFQICNRIFWEGKKKDTPHSELRFKTELNQKTSNSGHKSFLHIIVSTNIVRPVK